MTKNNTLTPVSESLMSLFTSLVGLAQFDKSDKEVGSRKGYFPSAELIMKLGETTKGWDISAFHFFKKDVYFAEIWTDKKSFRQLIVAFRRDEKGIWPVAFEVLNENTELTGVFSGVSRELLAERSEAALQSLEMPVVTNCTLQLKGRKQVA